MRRRGIALVLMWGLLSGTAHGAQLFGSAETVAAGQDTGLGMPRVVVLPSGEVVVAWATGGAPEQRGLYVSRRAAGGGPWSDPARVIEGGGMLGGLVGNSDGDLAVTWLTYEEGKGPLYRVAVGLDGQSFGAPEAPPALAAPANPYPPSMPPEQVCEPGPEVGQTSCYNPGSSEPDTSGQNQSQPSITLLGDGTVTAAYLDSYYYASRGQRTGTSRVVVSARPPGGSFQAPVQVAEHARQRPVAVSSDGLAHVVWCGAETEDANTNRLLFAVSGDPTRAMGAPVQISDPASDACGNDALPIVAANYRGDVLAAWRLWPAPAGEGRPAIPATADVAVARRTGGHWSPAETLPAIDSIPTVALGESGAMVVAWNGSESLSTRRGQGSDPFGPLARITFGTAGAPAPVSLDHQGMAVFARPGWVEAGSFYRLHGVSQNSKGRWSRPVMLGEPVGSDIGIGSDGYGNGVIVWTERGRIKAASWSSTPPSVTGVRAFASSVRLRVSEPARLRIAYRRGRQHAATRVRATTAGPLRVGTTPAMQRLASGNGDLVATVTARDAGPRRSRIVVR